MQRTHIRFIYSRRVRRALQLAEQAHRGARRKTGDHPYFLHLVAVAQLLGAAGADDDLLCAAFLHDAVEDTGLSVLQIGDEFGGRVAELVAAVTKPSFDAAGVKLPSDTRDELTRSMMATAALDVVALKAADLIANVSDLIFDQQEQGYDHWQELFGERVERKIGHYLKLADVLIERLATGGDYALVTDTLRERSDQLRSVFGAWKR